MVEVEPGPGGVELEGTTAKRTTIAVQAMAMSVSGWRWSLERTHEQSTQRSEYCMAVKVRGNVQLYEGEGGGGGDKCNTHTDGREGEGG